MSPSGEAVSRIESVRQNGGPVICDVVEQQCLIEYNGGFLSSKESNVSSVTMAWRYVYAIDIQIWRPSFNATRDQRRLLYDARADVRSWRISRHVTYYVYRLRYNANCILANVITNLKTRAAIYFPEPILYVCMLRMKSNPTGCLFLARYRDSNKVLSAIVKQNASEENYGGCFWVKWYCHSLQ